MPDVLGALAWVVVGLIFGWLAGVSMKSGGYGLIGDLLVGVVGAFAGAALFAFIVPDSEPNALAGTVIAAAILALVFVAIARVLTHRSVRPAPKDPETPKAV